MIDLSENLPENKLALSSRLFPAQRFKVKLEVKYLMCLGSKTLDMSFWELLVFAPSIA